MPRWQLVLGPASGGHTLDLTAATGRRYTAKLTEPSELAFTINGRHPQAASVDTLATDVHLLWTPTGGGTRILDRLRVGLTQHSSNATAHTTSVTCLDYKGVLRDGRRLCESTGDTLTYTGVDQAEIAWALVDTTQNNPGGGLGIFKGWTSSTPTGIPRTVTYEYGDSIGERIQQLAEQIDGFDWDITPVGPSAMRLDIWFPERGVDRGVVLIDGGLVSTWDRQEAPSDYGNAIRQTGADGLTAQERAVGDITTLPQGRWDRVFGDTTLTTQTMLNNRASWQIEQSQVIPVTWTVELRRGAWAGPDHIWLGDPVRLIVRSGALNVDAVYRVYEVDIDLDGDGGESVSLSLGGPRPDYRRRPHLTDTRLTNLERR